MAEHQKKSRKNKEDTEQKRSLKPQEHQKSNDNSHAWDQDPVAIAETPFWPRIEEHAELLSMPHSVEQRASLVMHLQKTYGNRYVQRLIESMGVQAKLTVNAPNDIYEQEADMVAEAISSRTHPRIQRQADEVEEGEETEEEGVEIQAEHIIQRQVDEVEEGEETEEEGLEIQAKPLIQRQADEVEEGEETEEEGLEIQAKPVDSVQRQVTDTIPEVKSETEDKINRVRGGGQPLDAIVREPMERAFGADFSGVRVHNDESADALNKSLQARAFTTGQDIFFRSGEYNPASSAGQQLIAHELTHTIQQTGKKKPENTSVQIGQTTVKDEVASRAVGKIPPPIPTSKPWKKQPKDETATVKIQDLAESGVDLGSGLKKAELIKVANFAEGTKNVAEEKGKNWFIKLLGTIVRSIPKGAGLLAKGAGFVVEKVKGTLEEGSRGAGILNWVKGILGPIPDFINTLVNLIKALYAASKQKSKEALSAVWETVKSGVSTAFATVQSIFSLISKLGGVVPIVGGIAKGVSAILGFIQSAYLTVKRILKLVSIKKIIAKVTELIKGSDEKGEKREEGKGKGKKERLEYIKDINIKRRRNIVRDLANQVTSLVTNGLKLGSAVLSVIGEIVTLAGVTAPVGAILKAFSTAIDIFSGITSFVVSLVTTYAPKALNWIRQQGRNLTAKVAKKEGKFSQWLAKGLKKVFDPEKSAERKKEKLKEVVAGLVDDASRIKTEFSPAGKDRSALIEEVKAEVPKLDALDFELEAMGVNKGDLYKLNKETSLGKRLKGQIKLIYSGLRGR